MTFPSRIELIDRLVPWIAEDMREIIKEAKIELIKENNAAGGDPWGFRHGGKRYDTFSASAKRKGIRYHPIEPELLPQANQLHADTMALQQDEQRLRQLLVMPLKECESYQDVRDMFPEMIAQWPYTLGIPRTRPQAYALKDQPLKLVEFDNLVELISYFISAKVFA